MGSTESHPFLSAIRITHSRMIPVKTLYVQECRCWAPGGRYKLNLKRPYHRAMLRMLCKTAERYKVRSNILFLDYLQIRCHRSCFDLFCTLVVTTRELLTKIKLPTRKERESIVNKNQNVHSTIWEVPVEKPMRDVSYSLGSFPPVTKPLGVSLMSLML